MASARDTGAETGLETLREDFASTRNDLYFVDASVPGAEALMVGLGECSRVYALENASDVFPQIEGALAASGGAVDAIHIYSHGREGALELGGRWVDASTLADNADRPLKIKVLRYKDQAETCIANFSGCPHASFEICDGMRELVKDADVVVSCITRAPGILAQPEWLKPGCLLVPVHTRGFQTCDLVFDKVFADDTAHVANFNYFAQFKKFAELGDVLRGTAPGRENDAERILSYNIGIALHDIVFSRHIIRLLMKRVEASLTPRQA